jgi:acetoin utilization protein AcuB
MQLQEIMNRKVVTIGPDEPAAKAITRMRQKRIRHLVVADEGRLVGIISERDLGGRDGGNVRKNRAVRDLMTPRVTSASPKTPLRRAANLMREHLIGSLPVVEGGRVIGIVTATDVLDELGRGSVRPAANTERREMRMPPAGHRQAVRRAGRPGRVHGSGAR